MGEKVVVVGSSSGSKSSLYYSSSSSTSLGLVVAGWEYRVERDRERVVEYSKVVE